jgi:hypothetical protein
MSTRLDGRHRDKNGGISRKHGNTLIGTLRKIYSPSFVHGQSEEAKLSDVLAKLSEHSLSQLVHVEGSGGWKTKCENQLSTKDLPSVNGFLLVSIRIRYFQLPTSRPRATNRLVLSHGAPAVEMHQKTYVLAFPRRRAIGLCGLLEGVSPLDETGVVHRYGRTVIRHER